MKPVVIDILKRTPPPDKLGKESETDMDEDQEGSEAAEMSAMEDLLQSLGLPAEKAEAALPALKDIIRACMKSGSY